MKVSKKGEYALRALVTLARSGEGGVLPIGEIAGRENIPQKFLEQIVALLKGGGFLTSRRGSAGGYSLARDPAGVTLGEVVRFVDGPLAPVSCASVTAYASCSCPDEATCGLKAVMVDVRNAIAEILDRTTLADVATRERALESRSSWTHPPRAPKKTARVARAARPPAGKQPS